MYNLNKIFKGVVSVKEENGLIKLSRFTDKQLETYKKISEETTYKRAKSLAGVKMEFVTCEKKLSFDFVCDCFCREWLGFDVYENGILHKVDLRDGICEGGHFEYTVENEGNVKIEIYMMFSAGLFLKNLSFGEIEYVEEEKINYLALGDSITQGMCTRSASMSYPAILGRMYNLNVLNHGVGGYWFDKKSLDKELSFEPDIITVAYGINDAMMSFRNGNDAAFVRDKAKEYLEELISIYPEADIKVIIPVWLAAEGEDEILKAHINSVREALTGLCVDMNLYYIDGLALVPHDIHYYYDRPAVHPNDAGFLHYAMSLDNAFPGFFGKVM
ncbi:MAG: hypothetical protein E7411_05395 [Ruminococcaceae bacterium]|nr:hypothetical protein [Oscillospiraceae bacterium]